MPSQAGGPRRRAKRRRSPRRGRRRKRRGANQTSRAFGPGMSTHPWERERQISSIISRDSTESRRAPGTERDVNSEFSQEAFTVHLPMGRRTSLIVDPPDGKMPLLTPEAQKAKDAFRQFQLALLQPTAACKEKHPGCAGGKYGPVSPRRNETPP